MNKDLIINLNNIVLIHKSFLNDSLNPELDYQEKINELISDLEDYLINNNMMTDDLD